MSEYPTQDFVNDQIKKGTWMAAKGEAVDIRSLTDKEIKILELYNQEEIIKQLRQLNASVSKKK